MDRKRILKNLADIGKDILVAFVVVVVVMGALWAYCGIWPPLVVVESGSMSRYDDRSCLGIIDTGDMVFVKTVDGQQDVTTYVDGQATEHSKYGTYGDVIIYRPNGDHNRTPIIHRAVLWLDVNTTHVNPEAYGIDFLNYSFDVPSLGLYGITQEIVLDDYGYWREQVTIDLSGETGLMRYFEYLDIIPHGGYITMGDPNAPAYDQPLSGMYEPVLPEWIVGKAWGEVPWVGLVKLKVTGGGDGAPANSWRNLFISVFLLLFIPFIIDMTMPRYRLWRAERRKRRDAEAPREKKCIEPPPVDVGRDQGGAEQAGTPGQQLPEERK